MFCATRVKLINHVSEIWKCAFEVIDTETSQCPVSLIECRYVWKNVKIDWSQYEKYGIAFARNVRNGEYIQSFGRENGKHVGDFDSGFDLVGRYDSGSEKRLNFSSFNSFQKFRQKRKVTSE